MKKRECNECGAEMIKKYTDNEGIKYFCEKCNAFTTYTELERKGFCNICGEKLDEESACGCISLFCKKCNTLKSKKDVVWK